MKLNETAELLKVVAALDLRIVDETVIEAWDAVIPDRIQLADAVEGVRAYYRRTDKRIMPSHVIAQADQAAARREGRPIYIGD